MKTSIEKSYNLQNDYVNNLIKFNRSLDKIAETQSVDGFSYVKDKLKVYSDLSEVCRLRSEILKIKEKVMVFGEEPNDVSAYKILLGDILEKQKTTRLEIQTLNHTLEEYKKVKSQEYDTILQTYLSLVSAKEEFMKVHNKLTD